MLRDYGKMEMDGSFPCGCRFERATLTLHLCGTHAERFAEFLEWETPSALTGKTPAQEHAEWDAMRTLANPST